VPHRLTPPGSKRPPPEVLPSFYPPSPAFRFSFRCVCDTGIQTPAQLVWEGQTAFRFDSDLADDNTDMSRTIEDGRAEKSDFRRFRKKFEIRLANPEEGGVLYRTPQ